MSTASEALFAALDPEMLVVTACDGNERAGCLVAFAMQCSIDPPYFVVAISVLNHTLDIARRAEGLGVHLLNVEQEDLARLFGAESGDELDKFSRCAWHDGRTGAPILDDCPVWIDGRVVATFDFGDHVGFQLDPIDGGGGLLHRAFRRSDVNFAAGHPVQRS